jgi:hypothetical protein
MIFRGLEEDSENSPEKIKIFKPSSNGYFSFRIYLINGRLADAPKEANMGTKFEIFLLLLLIMAFAVPVVQELTNRLRNRDHGDGEG